ncbi:MAG: TonB-dependent receptor [Candidatus Omnitrophica bacterium]|nr:TonB-dependent receptor [Candidatus Omnitrophota bacterium]
MNLRILLLVVALLWTGGGPAWAGDDASVEQMMEMSLEELLNITVTSAGGREQKMKEVSHAMFVIWREDIERSGARNVPDLLERVPGMHVQSVDANRYNVSIRGVPDAGVFNLLVLVDGVIVFNPMYNGTLWQSVYVTLDEIERIEIIRGPGGVLYSSNAVNGVINIITKPATSNENHVTMRTGNLDYRNAAFGVGHRRDKLSVRTFADFSYDRGYDKVKGVGDVSDRSDEESAGFKAQYDFNEDRKVVLDAKYKGFDGDNRGILGASQGKYQEKMYGASLRFDHKVSDSYDYFGKLDIIQHTWSLVTTHDSDILSFSGQTQHNYRFMFIGDHILSAGAELRFNRANIGAQTFPRPYANPHESQRVLSYFVQDEYRPGSKWIITPGLRVNSNQMIPDSLDTYLLEPRLAVVYEINKQHNLRLAATRSYRTPSMAERYIRVDLGGGIFYQGSPDIEPERVHTFEAGWRGLMLDDRLSLNADVFLMKVRDALIITDLEFPNINFETNGDMKVSGFEMDGQYALNEQWSVYGDYTYLNNKTDADHNSQYYAFKLKEQKYSRHQLGMGLRWTRSRLKLDAYVKWLDGYTHPASLDGVLHPVNVEFPCFFKTKFRIAYAFKMPGFDMDDYDAEAELVVNDVIGANTIEAESLYYREPDVWLGLKVKF